MAVPATAAAIVVMMLMVATLMSTSVVTASAAVTAASASHVLNQVLNLLFGSLAILDDTALEVKSLASKRVVGINGYSVFLNLYYLSHKLVVFVVHQCDNCTLDYVLVVKVAVNGRQIAFCSA